MAQQPLAYMDPEFLDSEEGRPIRIMSEYLDPLRRFREQKIQDTVVFFGSARVHSRVAAERALKRLRAGRRGGDYADALKRSRKAVEWSRYYEDARELAHQLTKWSLSLDAPRHRFVGNCKMAERLHSSISRLHRASRKHRLRRLVK